MIYDNCVSKLDLITITIFPGKFDIISISISLYILSMALDFTMNSLLFSDDVVSDNYHNEGDMSFLTSTLLSIISNVISSIISIIFVSLTNFVIYFEALDEEHLNEDVYIVLCNRILHYTQRKLVLYFILEFIFFIFFWYYVTLFCIVYHNNQVNWIVDCITGIGISLLYSFGVAFIISTLRYISLKWNIQKLYNVSNYFNN